MTYDVFRKKLLDACTDNQVLLISHMGPDDDSVGSMLAAKHSLQALTNATVTAAYEGERAKRWLDFAGYDELVFVDDLQPLVNQADVVVFLDGSELHRFSTDELEIAVPTFCIDHHACEEPAFDEYLIEPQRTSVAEMLYELFSDVVDERSARYLLLGIIGDTGNFRYINPDKAHVFSIAEDLVTRGDIDVELFQRTWGATHQEEFAVFAQLMGNAQIVKDSGWPTYCYSLIDEQGEHKDADISGGAHMFVSWIRGVKGVEWGFVLTPRSSGLTACSFRSSGVNVRHIAEGLDVGGGHDKAAGARFKEKPAEALKRIQDWIAKHKPEQS